MKRSRMTPPRSALMKVGLTCSMLWLPTFITAQSITPNVLASSGSSDNVQLQWTLGELAVATHDNGQNIVTEGFHQTLLILPPDPVGLNDRNGIQVNVYPNPTSDRVIINLTENDRDLQAELHDVNGKLLLRRTILKGQAKEEIQMSRLPVASYLLTIFSPENELLTTYKIQKTANH